MAKRRTGALQFIQEVRDEGRKVTWTTRRETAVTSLMVFIMVALAALFFFVVDLALNGIVSFALGLGA